MDKEIKGKNMIPGCEKYTQSWEIKELQKYLKQGISTRDSMLDLGKDNLGTPNADPNVVSIEGLEDKRLSISGNIEHVELPSDSLKITGNQDVVLNNNRLEISGNEDLSSLPNDLERISESSVSRLPDTQVSLRGNQDKALETDQEKLKVSGGVSVLPENIQEIPGKVSDTALSSLIDTLIASSKVSELEIGKAMISDNSEVPELPVSSVALDGDSEVDSLSTTSVKISAATELNLPDTFETISSTADIGTLENLVAGLEVDQDISLSTEKSTIQGTTTDISLEQTRKKIQDSAEVVDLEQTRKTIKDLTQPEALVSESTIIPGSTSSDISSLPTERHEIKENVIDLLETERTEMPGSTSSEVALETDRPSLKAADSDLDSLENSLETLGVENTIDGLISTKSKIPGNLDDFELETEAERLKPDSDPDSLGNIKSALPGTIEDQVLETSQEGLVGVSDQKSLSDVQEKLTSTSGTDSLSNTLETLSGAVDTESLEDYLGRLGGVSDTESLEDTRISLEPTPSDSDSLENTLEKLSGVSGTDSLENTRISLEPTPETTDSLEDHQEKLGGISDSSGLSDTRINLEPSPTETDSLEDYLGRLSGVADTDSLEDHQEKLSGISDPESLEDTRIDLEPSPSNPDSLEDYLGKLEADSDVSSLSDFFETLADSRENKLSDTQLRRPENSKNAQSGYIDKVQAIQDASEIHDLSGYFHTSSEGTDQKLPGPQNPDARFGKLDSLLGGVFTSIDSSEGLGISTTPQSDAEREVSSGSGDIMFVKTKGIQNNDQDITWTTGYTREYTSVQESLRQAQVIRPATTDNTNPEPDLSGVVIKGPAQNDPDSLSDTQEKLEDVSDLESLSDIQEKLEKPEELESLSDIQESLSPKNGVLDGIHSGSELWGYQDEKAVKGVDLGNGVVVPISDGIEKTAFVELSKYLGIDDPKTIENYQATVDELQKMGSWGKKVLAYLNAILSKNSRFFSTLPESDIETYKAAVLGSLKYTTPKNIGGEATELETTRKGTPVYKKPDFNLLSSLDASKYLREAAENTVGNLAKGATKKLLIDETLTLLVEARDLLEKISGASKSRLPGDSSVFSNLLSGGLTAKSVIKIGSSLLGDAVSSSDLLNPVNRPTTDGKNPCKGNYSVWKTERNTSGQVSFYNYIGTYGMKVTLEELCGQSTDHVRTVEELNNCLKNSAYITTASKTTDFARKDNVMTLDSNHIWEIRLFPYVGADNGYVSWLPAIEETNYRNWALHYAKTTWSEWIPFTSFELQKCRTVQKTLGLYDGEISYPVSMEFTNELRLTIADDAYKSWKNYFHSCADCAVYMSQIHDKDHYSGLLTEFRTPGDRKGKWSSIKPTPIVRGNISPGLYKNLAFRCIIYTMTPQYSTIHKSDLLVVLKDFVDEWQGETDSGPTDLTLIFSIVGENPEEKIGVKIGSTANVKNEMPATRTDYSSIISQGLSSVVGLL